MINSDVLITNDWLNKRRTTEELRISLAEKEDEIEKLDHTNKTTFFRENSHEYSDMKKELYPLLWFAEAFFPQRQCEVQLVADTKYDASVTFHDEEHKLEITYLPDNWKANDPTTAGAAQGLEKCIEDLKSDIDHRAEYSISKKRLLKKNIDSIIDYCRYIKEQNEVLIFEESKKTFSVSNQRKCFLGLDCKDRCVMKETKGARACETVYYFNDLHSETYELCKKLFVSMPIKSNKKPIKDLEQRVKRVDSVFQCAFEGEIRSNLKKGITALAKKKLDKKHRYEEGMCLLITFFQTPNLEKKEEFKQGLYKDLKDLDWSKSNFSRVFVVSNQSNVFLHLAVQGSSSLGKVMEPKSL